jgi:CheY-like chemotaxis protein
MSNRSLPSQLLNMLAPDIRSSLGELQGTLQLVAHDLAANQGPDSLAQRRLELVNNASERVSEFTNMLSIVTKLDALSRGDLKQRPERTDLLRLFDRLAHRMNGQCADAQVHLDVRFDSADHDRLRDLYVDAANLAQLLGYILRFAWVSTHQQKVSVEVSLTADDLRLVIADNGASMSNQELKQLFSLEPWSNESAHRLFSDDPTLRLGLSVSRAMAKEMTGVCDVRSDSSRGVVWSLVLPFPQPKNFPTAMSTVAVLDQTDGAEAYFGTYSKSEWMTKTLLLVDDSQSSRLVTRALLEDLGHEVTEAANGYEALVRIRTDPAGPFDAVILDLAMPEMDGISAAKAIRELPSIGDPLRLIAHTGHSSEAERQACREAGFDDFLSKPVDKDSLKRCLQRTLGVGGSDRPPVRVNVAVLDDLQNVVGVDAMVRLLGQFLVELDERMQIVLSLEASNLEDVHHNLHMMRYSAEHFGFEHLAQCARRLSQIRMSIDDLAINHSDPLTPALVFRPSDAALRALEQLQDQVRHTKAYLSRRLQEHERNTSLDNHE